MENINTFIHTFSFFEQWNIILFIILSFFSFLFIKAIIKSKDTKKTMRIFSFFIGVALIFTVYGTPVNLLSDHYLFMFKMIQESVSLYAAPLFIIGAFPVDVLRKMLWNHKVRNVVMMFTNPVISMVLFYILFTIYHFPNVFTFLMNNVIIGTFYETLLVISSILMWWAIMSPLPGVNHLTDIKKGIFLIINSILLILPMLPIAYLELTNYSYVGHEVISSMTKSQDFKLGAAIILIYQKILASVIIGIIFINWFNREDKIDPINVSGMMGVKRLNHHK